MRHPHLATLQPAPTGNGFELEPSDGLSLEKLVEGPNGEGRLALRIRVRILLDVLSGLAALHRAKVDGKPIGFVHGEVAPHNIIVGRDGLGRLVPLVQSHWSTPPVPAEESLGYVAPERLLGDVFDQRADVFSVGVLLWEAITEKRLFQNMRMDSIVTQLVGNKVERPPAPPAAPWADALADVAMQALSVDPADRWPQIGVMGAEIESIAEGALASSDEIARLVRYRLGERIPPPTEAPITASTSVAPRTSSLPPSGAPASGAPGRASGAPPQGLVVWRGPAILRTPRTPADGGRRRDSMRPSVSDLDRGRPSREIVVRQSRIIWAAVGVGLALFAITAYELVDRDPPSSGASANTAQVTEPPTPAPPPVAAPVPAPAPPPRENTAPTVAAGRSRDGVDTARSSTKSGPSTPVGRNSLGRASSKSESPSAGDSTRSQGKAAPTPAPTPTATPAPAPPPPPAASPPEPAPPPLKPKEDPFGI
jgi:serine/threonine-protein kinase